jgi:hypothetical protein
MATRKGLWTGIASGAATGAATGSVVGGVGAIPGALLGAVAGGLSGSMDDTETDYERAMVEDERRRQAMESQFSHLMALRGEKQTDRTQGMNALQLLAAQRGNAEANARKRMLRNALLAA